MAVPGVDKKLLCELEEMGFPEARATRALHYSGNSSVEAAINWIIDHENDADIDEMPLSAQVPVDIPIEASDPFFISEEMKLKAPEISDQVRKNREVEEKKLERSREKERIRAGKGLQVAKRMAEENERKRNVAQRKADVEEKRRARERVRQKLQQDKAERRGWLGLPVEGPLSVNPAISFSHESKNLELGKPALLTVSARKEDLMRECLRSLKRQVMSRVGKFKEGVKFLELCGFEIIGGEFLYLPKDKVDMATLAEAWAVLNSAITNPYFGLFSRSVDAGD
nr:UBX domain-containing protein 1-like isoform X3 [Coffea arabica]